MEYENCNITRTKKFGDRSDGFRIKKLSATQIASIRYMKGRLSGQVFSNFNIDLTKTENFIKENRSELKGLSMQIIVFSALVRTYAKFPRCGRFIIGNKLYGRDYTKINIMIKPTYTEDDEEILLPLLFNRNETLPDVLKIYNETLKFHLNELSIRKKKKEYGYKTPAQWFEGNIDYIAAKLSKIVMFLDKHRLLPGSLMEISPFHGSAFVTNVGSIR